jgi:hypothetical protein
VVKKEVVGTVRLTKAEADALKAEYGSLPAALRAGVDKIVRTTKGCRIHEYGDREEFIHQGTPWIRKTCTECGHVTERPGR